MTGSLWKTPTAIGSLGLLTSRAFAAETPVPNSEWTDLFAMFVELVSADVSIINLAAVGILFTLLWIVIRGRTNRPGTKSAYKADSTSVSVIAKAGHNPGQATILISVVLAFISMFLGWERSEFRSADGKELQLMMLLMIWLYPVVVAIFEWPMIRKVGRFIAGSGVIITIILMLIIANKSVFLFNVDLGAGAWLFLLSTIMLAGGIDSYCMQNDSLVGDGGKPAMEARWSGTFANLKSRAAALFRLLVRSAFAVLAIAFSSIALLLLRSGNFRMFAVMLIVTIGCYFGFRRFRKPTELPTPS